MLHRSPNSPLCPTPAEPLLRSDADPFAPVLAEIHQVFARPAPRSLGICPCPSCLDADLAAALQSSPQHALPRRALAAWYAAPVVSMSKPVWAWFLPSVLSSLAYGLDPTGGRKHLSLARFPTGVPAMWSPAEWRVIDRFRQIYLQEALQNAGPGVDLFEAVRVLLHAGWPLADLVRQLTADPDLPQALARAWGFGTAGAVLFPGPWPPGAVRALRASLMNEAMVQRLHRLAKAPGVASDLVDDALAASDVIRIAAAASGH